MKSLYTQAEPLPYLNVSEGAKALGVTNQRLSRALKILRVPVIRKGYTVLFPKKKLEEIKRYLVGKKSGAKKTG